MRKLTHCLVWLGLLAGLTTAQSRFGTVYGVVSDSSGAVVPGAKVIVTDQATNIAQEVLSDSGGRYQFPVLPIGSTANWKRPPESEATSWARLVA